jgi:hypothetical protein
MFKKTKKIDTFFEDVDGINLLLANQLGAQRVINIIFFAPNLAFPQYAEGGQRLQTGRRGLQPGYI